MECEDIIRRVRLHAVTRIKSAETLRGCRISLPLLEPSGDVIAVTVSQGSRPGVYYVSDGGRLNGLLFESSSTKPSAADRNLVDTIAKRATLKFDDERRVYYATAKASTLGYWAFEVGRTIATVASVVPPLRRRRGGRKLSTYIISQLERELNQEGLRSLMRGPRRIRGITETEQRVDLSYRARREPLGDQTSIGDIFVIAADLKTRDPVKPARDAVITAHDLSALDDEPIIRIVHGVVDSEGHSSRTEQARRLIESVASASGIEQYSWNNETHKIKFVTIIRNELAQVSASLRSEERIPRQVSSDGV